jgi:ABC-type transport system involved in multi-copper enzyme maturation permease subunit
VEPVINIQNILTVSRYERKILYRSWFFRIFSFIALFFLFGINMGNFGFHGGIRWTARAIAANLPYFNVLVINVAQAIIAVFLASDFLKRDKKLDTTEVIYTRPISNGEYVVGKTAGILTLFIGVVVLALIMSLIFNLIRQDTPVVWSAYVYYPVLITIPTLVFILGLSFFLMITIRNQAVTFAILLGYIGLTLFYFKDKLYGILDYMAFNLPMVYSDFIGFGDPYRILLHRLAFFLMGVGLIFATIRYLGRLPQTGRWNAINTIAFVGFFVFGAFLGYRYYSVYQLEDRERAEYLALNNSLSAAPVADIVSNDLYVEQNGRRLRISSEMLIRNQTGTRLDTLIFSLNPGFRIDSITSLNGPYEFTRNRQILRVIPAEGLGPGRRASLNIYYSGIPEESIAYLDIPDETLRELKRFQMAVFDKKPGIISDEFLLLTPELFWYPRAGVGFNHKTFLPGELDFIRFNLTVKPNGNLTAVAAGEVEMIGDEFHFRPDADLSALSLVIGPLEKRSLTFEDVEYNLYLKPDHDYFSGFFSNITDTLGYLIKDRKDEFEIENLDLYYPFNRINLVEVPVQFHAYDRPQIQTVETVQPEMILLPEKGVGLNPLDFARYKAGEERANRRANETMTPKEIELRLFLRFLDATFFQSETRSRPLRDSRQRSGEELMTYQGGLNYGKNPYNVFPLYYSYMTGISSRDYPLFNSMLEIYLKEGFEVSLQESIFGGMTDNERANLALRDNSITEILAEWDNTITSALVSQAGSFIFLALKNRVGMGAFDNFLYYYLEDYAFREISFEQFSSDFYREFGVEVEPYFETINTRGQIPTMIMSSPEYILTRDEIGEVYLVRFQLRNTGEVKGLVDVSFRVAGSFGAGMATEQRLYELDPGITKDIQVTLFEPPRMMTVNTLISGNIPSSFSTFLRSAENVNVTATEEYERISDRELTLQVPGEFVVDNEDPGFRYVSVSHESNLKQYIESRKEESNEVFYGEMRWEWTPATWTPVVHSGFYGESVRSAMVTRTGGGENIASWTTILPSAGFYDVYVYIPTTAMVSRMGGRGMGGGGQGGQPQGGSAGGPGGPVTVQAGRGMGPSLPDRNTVYNYIISSNEGSEEVEFPLRNVEDGWNRVGAFHFPADTARIELSNNANGRRVIADAVKWVIR